MRIWKHIFFHILLRLSHDNKKVLSVPNYNEIILIVEPLAVI